MHLVKGGQVIPKGGAHLFNLINRLMLFLHLAYGIVKRMRIHTVAEFHISLITVITHPVLRALLGKALHTQENVIVKRSVLRKILINALHGKLQVFGILVEESLADTLRNTSHLLCKAPGHHSCIALGQRLA